MASLEFPGHLRPILDLHRHLTDTGILSRMADHSAWEDDAFELEGAEPWLSTEIRQHADLGEHGVELAGAYHLDR